MAKAAAQKLLSLEETGVKRWSHEEAYEVALRYYPLRQSHPELDLAIILEQSQKCLAKDRHRSFASRASVYNTTPRLNRIWDEYAAKNPKQAELFLLGRAQIEQEEHEAEEKSAEIATTPEPPKPETPSVIAEKLQAALNPAPVPVAAPSAPAPTPAPALVLGPLELAMAQMVQRAVEASLGNIILELKSVIAEQQDYIHTLMNTQHDSLMGYFDEDFKRAREIQAEFLSPGINPHHAQLKQVRMRRKKVLIVCTNNIRGTQNSIEPKFSGIDFTFVDGNQQRQVNAGGYYDLVLCNNTNRHTVKDKLALLHGVKVVYTDGGSSSMIDVIRQKLGI